MNRFVAATAAFLMVTGLLAGAALAHAQLAKSNPSAGQTLAASPATVDLTYGEDLAAGSTGSVTDASGATVSTGATISTTERAQMSIALKPSLPNGVYKVLWHSISADDGDALDGTFFFGVGVPAPSTATLPASGNTAAISLLVVAGALGLVSVLSLRSRRAMA
jgi:methionine-rich copper-binding protein CopC